jgi:hypothetical protein
MYLPDIRIFPVIILILWGGAKGVAAEEGDKVGIGP